MSRGESSVVLGASVNVLVNLLSINLTALALLWVAGYRPEMLRSAGTARSKTLSRIAVIVVAIVVLSAGLGLDTYATNQTAVYNQQATGEVRELFVGPQAEFGNSELIETRVTYRPLDFYRDNPAQLRVVVDPTGTPPPDLAQQIDDRVSERTGKETAVEVVFVQSQESSKWTE